MAKIPVYQRQVSFDPTPQPTAPMSAGVTETGAVRQALRGATGLAMQELGNAKAEQQRQIAELEKRKREDIVFGETETARSTVDGLGLRFASEIQSPEWRERFFGAQDKEKYLNDFMSGYEQEIDKLASFGTYPETRQAVQRLIREKKSAFRMDMLSRSIGAAGEYEKSSMLTRFDTLKMSGKAADAVEVAQTLFRRGRITPDQLEAMKNDAVMTKVQLDIQASVPITGDSAGDKAGGYAIIDQYQKDGLIGPDENKQLGDWLDNYVEGRARRMKDQQKKTSAQHYTDFSGKIIDGSLTFEDIAQSGLSPDEKEKWTEYLRKSFPDAPPKTSYDGHFNTLKAVMGVNSLELTPQEAYDVLLDQRYVKRTITDEEFKTAASRIQKPYPKEVVEPLRRILNENRARGGERFYNVYDRSDEQRVNAALLDWIDGELAKGKTPTLEEMHVVSSQYRAVGKNLYKVGSVIEVGELDILTGERKKAYEASRSPEPVEGQPMTPNQAKNIMSNPSFMYNMDF